MDKRFYEQAAIEAASGQVDMGLMAKAAALSDGDPNKAKAKYITLRAEELQAQHRRATLAAVATGAASTAATGVVLASKATVVTAEALWPIFIKLCKVFMWIIIVIAGMAILIKILVSSEIRSARNGSAPAGSAQIVSVDTTYRDYPLGTTEAQMYRQYNAMLDQLEAKYSPANPASPNFNRAFIVRLEQRIAFHESRGLVPVLALKQAARDEAGIVLDIPPAR